MTEEFEVTAEMLRKRPEMVADGYKVGDKIPGRVLHAKYSRYMQRVAEVAPELVAELAETGARFTPSLLDRADRHDLAVARQQRQSTASSRRSRTTTRAT